MKYKYFGIFFDENTYYTDSVKSIHFLLILDTKFAKECQIELGFREIIVSAELNTDDSENF